MHCWVVAACSSDDAAPATTSPTTTHHHHGPDTAFSINDEWYDTRAEQVAEAIYNAATLIETGPP